MKIGEMFESKYLKAADLQNREHTVVMNMVAIENVGQEDKPENKPVLYFQGASKGMVLNKTNAEQIAMYYGDDTDKWAGQSLILFTMMVPFNGQNVPAVRVRAPAQSAPAAPAGNHIPDPLAGPPINQQQVESENPNPLGSDEIPF